MKRNLPETDTNGALPEQFREHPAAQKKTDVLLDLIRDGRLMTLRQQLRLTVGLSVPAIIARLPLPDSPYRWPTKSEQAT